ncbi:hypothetical protein [Adhaeribacter rhizoryzae]|uniref:YD repeat-containing protein n=1 Tax=Adhaeribacter rhizoryzae TaxID=2607907 RepID=A0A5M6DF64_9BACT|nr:hypothetical protein [Adhaeribacter rhizoryzae]KAA5545030.1 hypothetical protein F0145_13325 [Adhaeribacter rhizoryzae]
MKKTPLMLSLTLRPLTWLLGFTLLLGACQEDQILPRETPTNQNPGDTNNPAEPGNPVEPGTPNNPNTPVDPNNPGNGQPDPGQQPNPMPTGKFVQLKWSELDFQRVDYDNNNLITRYVSQYNSSQGSNAVTNFTQEFHYDANKRLVKQTSNVYGNILFFYNGNQLEKAMENDKLDRPLKEYYFTFRTDGKLESRLTYKVDLNNNKTEYQKQVYKYDTRGNLVILEDYFKNPATNRLELSTRFFFEDFDDKKAAIPFLATYPYLPQFTAWVNNPRVKYARNKDGYELSGRERYGYTYNTDGFPGSQIRSTVIGNGRPDVTFTGNYIYNFN